MNKFPLKKLTIATAVSVALGGVGALRAAEVGIPGNAILVPYAEYSTTNSTNTLVGITVPYQEHGTIQRTGLIQAGITANAGPLVGTTCNLLPYNPVNSTAPVSAGMHWYFFDATSVHQADGNLAATQEDFVPFDWRAKATASAAIQAKTDGVKGYLIFANNAAIGGGPTNWADACYFADAIYIRGVWESAAYIPTLALSDTVDAPNKGISIVDNITYSGDEPRHYSPVLSGMLVQNGNGVSELVHWDMRYFLPQTGEPVGETDLVVWFPFNGHTGQSRVNIPIDVWDTGENSGSTNIDLPKELNVVDAATVGWTDWLRSGTPPTGIQGLPAQPGATLEGESQGFITFDMPELRPADEWSSSTGFGPCPSPSNCFRVDTSTPFSGSTFSLIGLLSTGNASQVQTILGHERGIY